MSDNQNGPVLLGVVCGLKSEAAAVRAVCDDARIRIGVSGAKASRAGELAGAFVSAGAKAVLSVGVSGGLDPDLRAGALVIAHAVAVTGESAGRDDVIDPGNGLCTYLVHGKIVDEDATLAKALENAMTGQKILGSDEIIASSTHKASLYRRTGALAVDMESHAVARTALAAGRHFLAVRAIADPAARAMPPAALEAVAPDGGTNIGAVLKSLAKRPGQAPALAALGIDARAADQRMRASLGPLFRRLLVGFDLGELSVDKFLMDVDRRARR